VSKLICSRNALAVFAVGFAIYFIMKSYLISVSVGSDAGKESLMSLSVNDVVSSTMVPMHGTITTINSSLEALFGNESCRLDVLGAPAYVCMAGCNKGECDRITCKRLLVGDEEAFAEAAKFTDWHPRKVKSEADLLQNAKNCAEFKRLGGYLDAPVRPSDSDFPIAFNILVHWHLEQFERLLRAIYRPQNVYCVHVDAKTSWTFHSTIVEIAQCLGNVYIATRRQFVVYAGFSRLQVRTLSCSHSNETTVPHISAAIDVSLCYI